MSSTWIHGHPYISKTSTAIVAPTRYGRSVWRMGRCMGLWSRQHVQKDGQNTLFGRPYFLHVQATGTGGNESDVVHNGLEKEPAFWRHSGGVRELRQPRAGAEADDDDFDLYVRKHRRTVHARDEYKESSRKLFRTVFDFENWAEHRATSRYARHIAGIFESRLVHGLASPLVSVAVLAIVVATGHELMNYGKIVVPEALKDVLFINSALPMSLTSSVLGLLLVFRTNSSYSRWLDARKNWGLLVNRSRDLVRQGLTWLPEDANGQVHRGTLCRWVVALSYCLKCHLRENEDAVEKLRQLQILQDRELEALKSVRHKPAYAMQVLSMIVRKLAESNPHCHPVITNMEFNITQLGDVCGSCERILKTPIPLSYTRHTSRFMIIWLSLLPFALWETCGWGMVPLTVAISLLTLGVEEIGVTIEEPFSVLPLERICATIASDVKELRACGSGSDLSSAAMRENAVMRGIVPVASLLEENRTTPFKSQEL